MVEDIAPINLEHINRLFSLLQASEMASLSSFRWQNRKERTNRSTNNRDTVHGPNSYVVCE